MVLLAMVCADSVAERSNRDRDRREVMNSVLARQRYGLRVVCQALAYFQLV